MGNKEPQTDRERLGKYLSDLYGGKDIVSVRSGGKCQIWLGLPDSDGEPLSEHRYAMIALVEAIVAAVRAELLAPDDRAAEDTGKLLEEFCGTVLKPGPWDRLCDKVDTAFAAVRAERDEKHLEELDAAYKNGKENGVKAEHERWEAAARDLIKHTSGPFANFLVPMVYIEKLAALVEEVKE